MIVFSKLDRQTARQLHELKSLMRLEQIVRGGNHDVSETTFNIKSRENVSDIFNWCMKFRVPILPTDMPYNFPLAWCDGELPIVLLFISTNLPTFDCLISERVGTLINVSFFYCTLRLLDFTDLENPTQNRPLSFSFPQKNYEFFPTFSNLFYEFFRFLKKVSFILF